MDNKITKKRISLHLEYDWLKYILLILASAFIWYMVFMQINITRDFERVDVFFACYTTNTASLDEDFLDVIKREGDDVIREVNISYQTPNNEFYGQLLMSAGFTSDILIVSRSDMQVYGSWFLPLTDDVLDRILPDGLTEVDYYVYTGEGLEENRVDTNAIGTRFGIRVDNLKRMNVENPPFVFDVSKVNPNLTEEELENYPSEFYIVIDRNSVKIGEYGEKEQYRDLTQSFRFVRYFLESYAL